MKAYITEGELWPCYEVTSKKVGSEYTVDVSEEKINEWRTTAGKFFHVQTEISNAIHQYKVKQEEIKHLRGCFAKSNPSRQDKGYILQKFGWLQIDTSLWH